MKKIAIVRRNGLGDLLCALPLVCYFQQKEPETHITLFVDERNACLVPYLPSIDRVEVIPRRGNKYLNVLKTALHFRGEFEEAYSAKTSPMKLANLFLYALNAKKRVAYVDKAWHGRLINHPLPFDPVASKRQHQALKTLHMVDPELKEVPEALYPTLNVEGAHPLDLPSPVILVSATTTSPSSRFDERRYADLLNQLPVSVLIIGQKRDEERASAIACHLTRPHLVHFPRNFATFMLLLKEADAYFVGDGGVAHIGAALGKRAVVLFGATNPLEWHPLSKDVETFYDPTHVNHLEDAAIFQALTRMVERWKRA